MDALLTQYQLILVPGWQGSGEGHWQQHWLRYKGVSMLQQADWDFPVLADWQDVLQAAIAQAKKPVLLAAHSLGCALVAHWAQEQHCSAVHGALLVAPADVNSIQHTPEILRNFAPMPIQEMGFSSIVVASSNDPYVSEARAQYFATQWHSKYVAIGEYGHINADSHLRAWPTGQNLLQQLGDTR